MSGSGPAVFGLFENKKKALYALKALEGIPAQIFVEHTCRKKI